MNYQLNNHYDFSGGTQIDGQADVIIFYYRSNYT